MQFVVSCASRSSHVVDVDGKLWVSGDSACSSFSFPKFTDISRDKLFSSVSRIYSHTLALDVEQHVWGWGAFLEGELGVATGNKTVPLMSRFPGLPRMKFILAGYNNSFFIDNDGIPWSCGYNHHGELGINSKELRCLSPTKIPTKLPEITAIAAAQYQTLFLDHDGSVWSCGQNAKGELGLGDVLARSEPIKIMNLPPIRSIAAGCYYTLFLDYDANIWMCGTNRECPLLPELICATPVKIANIPPMKTASLTNSWSLFIDERGDVWRIGDNRRLALGHPNEHKSFNSLSKVEDIPPMEMVCTNFHSLFVDENRSLWGCGRNLAGELGMNHVNSVDVPQLISDAPQVPHPVRRGMNAKNARKIV